MNEILLKRKAYSQLKEWKEKWAPHYGLFIKGARRVGKTTLAESFGANEYKSFITISFQEVDQEIKKLFVESLLDLDYFFNVIQARFNKKLYRNESLIILDEIQLFPLARQALKTLLKDGRYHYIETGSLASITKKSKEILIPSEEKELNLYPLDYEEFLWAIGDEVTFDLMKQHFSNLKPLNGLHQSFMKSFRTYMMVGGMPQAVIKYKETKDFSDVDAVKQDILNLYEKDIKQQEEENVKYLIGVFKMIPSELSKHDKTFKLSHIDTHSRIRDYGGSIQWMKEAFIANIAHSVSDISIAFNLNTSDSFKCYMMDTGLLISLAYKNQPYLENELYKAILTDRTHVNEGMLLENIVAQILRASGHEMYFYKNYDASNHSIEVEFLLRHKTKVVPIEVKSGSSKSIASLTKFMQSQPKKIGKAYVLHQGEMKIDGKVIFLPYYMACFL